MSIRGCAVDCAKARSKWMLTDFYGPVVVPPTVVEHNRAAFDHMLVVIRQSTATHKLKDVVVAVEAHRSLPPASPARFRWRWFRHSPRPSVDLLLLPRGRYLRQQDGRHRLGGNLPRGSQWLRSSRAAIG